VIYVIECKPWPDLRTKDQEIAAPRTPEDRQFRRVVKTNEIRKGNTPLNMRREFQTPRQERAFPGGINHTENDMMNDFNIKK
jgi:hypothetical protein